MGGIYPLSESRSRKTEDEAIGKPRKEMRVFVYDATGFEVIYTFILTSASLSIYLFSPEWRKIYQVLYYTFLFSASLGDLPVIPAG